MTHAGPQFSAAQLKAALSEIGWDENELIYQFIVRYRKGPSKQQVREWLDGSTQPWHWWPKIAAVTGKPMDYFSSQPVN